MDLAIIFLIALYFAFDSISKEKEHRKVLEVANLEVKINEMFYEDEHAFTKLYNEIMRG